MASWFTVSTVTGHAGTIPAANGKVWGYRTVRIDYRGGGHQIVTLPSWLHALLAVDRIGGRVWNRYIKAGTPARRDGWVVVNSAETAAEARETEL